MTLTILGLLLFGYLVGSIPFSAVITRWRIGQDLYEIGEGNVGARNVWHVVGPAWGVLAGLLDGFKGWVTYTVSSAVVHAPVPGILLAGFGVVLGHQFPLYWGGRGGKGLAAMEGFLLGLALLPALAGLVVLGVMYALTRDANFSIIFGPAAIIASAILLHEPAVVIAAVGFGILAGVKKLIDLPHEREVWLQHPWQGTSDRPAIPEETASDDPDLAQAADED
ncbi:MAG: glycerol-3-phosphate acyltransferase [Ktedonobacterales bacterium]